MTDLIRRNMMMVKQDGNYPPSNEIWYTSSNGNMLELNDTSCLGEVLYHKKRGSKYVIRFTTQKLDYTNVFKSAYYTSLLLPEGTTKSIANFALRYSHLIFFEVPYSCETVGIGNFNECGGLKTLKTNGNVGVYNISNNLNTLIVGKNTTSLRRSLNGLPKVSIVVESGNTIYDSRDDCNAVIETATDTLIQACETTTIPNSVYTLGNGAFMRGNMQHIELHENIQSIEAECFGYCTNLLNINIPDLVKYLRSASFMGCSSLTNIKLSRKLLRIGETNQYGDGVFRDCTSLKMIDIPETVVSFGTRTFYNCISLETIVCRPVNPPTTYGADHFYNTNSLVAVYVPNDSVAAYKAANVWNTIADRIKPLSEYTE